MIENLERWLTGRVPFNLWLRAYIRCVVYAKFKDVDASFMEF